MRMWYFLRIISEIFSTLYVFDNQNFSLMDPVGALRHLRRWRRERRLRLLRDVRTNLRHLRDTSDPFQTSEELFRKLYRLTQDMARVLIEELRPVLAAGQRVTHIPLETKVLCALHFYAQGSYQRSTGSDRNVSLSQPSVSRAIKEITEWLNSPQILGKWIIFPLRPNERAEAILRNYQNAGMPGVLGYVDGTHIAIKAPREEEHLYVNRKLFHSINVQIVSNSDLKIYNILARYPGSSHDSFVWANSAIRQKLAEFWATGERCWLLGDSGYPHEPWLHTPILDAAEGTPEARFTRLHVKARSAVERCIGLLKGMFRCLLQARKMEYDPSKVCQFVNACSVLHNMCMLGGVPYGDDEFHMEDEIDRPPPVEQGARALLLEARAVRGDIIRRLQY
ncbi:putative nuclease HARBI1 isoform X1 [Ischnura elegans]|uniref:putative nuclease HARBI1 isoform X1 n=3 Tax=Ischnura elegans TaxID=197161 RepID=UPI001ED8A35E|nr:putative nuclease HARBI1 isoform X1 [Ischnura elegans]